MLVYISKEDIENGVRINPLKCPFANGVNHLLKPEYYAWAAKGYLYIMTRPQGLVKELVLSDRIRDFIECFDEGNLPNNSRLFDVPGLDAYCNPSTVQAQLTNLLREEDQHVRRVSKWKTLVAVVVPK